MHEGSGASVRFHIWSGLLDHTEKSSWELVRVMRKESKTNEGVIKWFCSPFLHRLLGPSVTTTIVIDEDSAIHFVEGSSFSLASLHS